MAASVIRNDFSAGIISARLFGRYNSAPYQNGAMRLVNFAIMPQGGITRRPGTVLKNTPDHSAGAGERSALVGSRLIPFCLRTDMNFTIELGHNCLRVWRQDCDELMRFTYNSVEYTTLTIAQLPDVTSLYTVYEAEQVQFAQDYEHLYLVHRNHKPLVITYSEDTDPVTGSLVPKLDFADFVPILQTEGSDEHPTGDTENAGLFTGNDCPGVIFYYASRLWFGSSKAHPYRLWGSRPFRNTNFEFYDVEDVADEGAREETIENAIIYGILSVESNNDDLSVSISKSTWERVIDTTGEYIYMYDGINWMYGQVEASLATLGISYTGTPTVNTTITVHYYNVNEGTTTKVEVEREDSAIRLEVGSSRNDEIKWITSMGNYIVVGTASAEWIMPGTINALNASIIQVSAYGSTDDVQPVMAGNDIIYVQTGGRKARNYIGGSQGYSSADLNFTSGEFGIIRHMAFQRIPEQRLYCVMDDGTLKVLFYDRQYSLQGWASYEFDGLVKDVCVTESSAGQTVYLSILRNIGDGVTRLNLEALDEKDIMSADDREDCSNYEGYSAGFTSEITTCPYENTAGGSSLGKRKRIYSATIKVLNTDSLTVGYRYRFEQSAIDEKYFETRSPDMTNMMMDDVIISIPGGFERYVAFTARVTGKGPATLTALSLLIEGED